MFFKVSLSKTTNSSKTMAVRTSSTGLYKTNMIDYNKNIERQVNTAQKEFKKINETRTKMNARRCLIRFFSFRPFTLPSLGLFGSIGSPGTY